MVKLDQKGTEQIQCYEISTQDDDRDVVVSRRISQFLLISGFDASDGHKEGRNARAISHIYVMRPNELKISFSINSKT